LWHILANSRKNESGHLENIRQNVYQIRGKDGGNKPDLNKDNDQVVINGK
jgi:hypothetical protein